MAFSRRKRSCNAVGTISRLGSNVVVSIEETAEETLKCHAVCWISAVLPDTFTSLIDCPSPRTVCGGLFYYVTRTEQTRSFEQQTRNLLIITYNCSPKNAIAKTFFPNLAFRVIYLLDLTIDEQPPRKHSRFHKMKKSSGLGGAGDRDDKAKAGKVYS